MTDHKEVPLEDLRITANHVDQVVDGIKNILKGHKLSLANVIDVVGDLINVTGKMTDLPNQSKKKVLILGLEKYLTTQDDVSEDVRNIILATASPLIGGAIDVLCRAKKALESTKCFKLCC